MSLISDFQTRPEDVGEILVKVQQDLESLKDRLLNQGDSADIDISALESAIKKTEQGIKSQTDGLLYQLNNQVQTIPNVDTLNQKNRYNDSTLETTWDLRTGQKQNAGPKIQHRLQHIPLKKPGSGLPPADMSGPTPGEQSRTLAQIKQIRNPHNIKNRDVMNKKYGIELPVINDNKPDPSDNRSGDVTPAIIISFKPTIKPAKGSTVEPLAVLPADNRRDPQLLPPPITEKDARHGILSLMERGLIPPAAELHLEPSPVRHKMAHLHDPSDKDRRNILAGQGIHPATFKLDPAAEKHRPKSETSSRFSSPSPELKSRGSSAGLSPPAIGVKKTKSMAVKTIEMPLQPLPPPTTPASGGEFKEKTHRFAIQHGKTRDQAPEFLAFKQHYCLSWGSIVSMIKHLEKVFCNYSVPIAFINGDKLADLSLEFELEKPPSIQDLLQAVINREDVENIIFRPGRRYMGPNGKQMAASKIQATYRMHRERTRYLDYRKKKWAAGVIAISWIMHLKMSRVRKQLEATRRDQLENFRRRAKTFAKNWDRIKSSKRVVIHMPSLGYSKNIRDSIAEPGVWQNTQMARLCDIRDPNVDVIYVAPVPINEEMAQYYSKLLGLKSAIDSGNVEDQVDLSDRYKIITPEAIKAFPSHKMCLSTQLMYSPKTLNRIKNLIRGREAFMVTGVPHRDDLAVADALNVPILCPEPDVAHLYSTKSGTKRIFASATVSVPPGEYDVYSLSQLHECLATLVTENLEVTRWLFKLDNEYDGRGIAYCDVSQHLKCYSWAVKEAQRYGEKWSKKWAQEAAYIKIHGEIPTLLEDHATTANKKVFPDWKIFLTAFLSKGGIIEACPPSDSTTAITVDMLIEPSGAMSIISLGDQIHAESLLSCWGLSVPQSSVEPEDLNASCFKVAEACKARGVVGYFTIDFVTFIHPKTMQQEIWAIDLGLSFSDSLAMFRLMEFVTGGKLDDKTHFYDVPPPKKEEKKNRRRRVKEEDAEPPNLNRYAVLSSKLFHTNLSVVHYSVYFQMCRAHGIGYDIKEKQGTVFTLVDSTNRENIGMVTVGDNLQGALATFARNLSVIHQEISAPNMQGTSNFKAVIEDIEAILGTTVQNDEDGASTMSPSTITDVERT